MPTKEELQEMTTMVYGNFDFNALGASGRREIMGLVIAAKQVEALKILAHVQVYQDFPEGYHA